MGFLNTIGQEIGSVFSSIFGRRRPTGIPKTNTLGNIGTGIQSFGSGVSQGFNPPANPQLSNQGYSYTPPAVQPVQQVQQPPVNQGVQQPNAGAYTYSGGVNALGQGLQGYNPQPTYTPPPFTISANQTPTTNQLATAQNGFAVPTTDFTQGITNSNNNIQSIIDRIFNAPAISPEAQTAQTNLTNTNQQFNDVTAQIQKLTADAIATQESIQSQPGELASIAEARANVFNNQFRKNIQPLVDQANNLKVQAANYQQQMQFYQTSANDLLGKQISAGNLGINLAQLPIQQATAIAKLQEASRGEVIGSPMADDNGNVAIFIRKPNGDITVNEIGQYGRSKTSARGGFGGRIVPAETVNVISASQDMVDTTQRLQELLKQGAGTGILAPGIANVRGFFNVANPNQEEAKVLFARIRSLYTYIISGKQVSDVERKALASSLPDFSNQESVNAVRIPSFINTVQGLINNRIKGLGLAGYNTSQLQQLQSNASGYNQYQEAANAPITQADLDVITAILSE